MSSHSVVEEKIECLKMYIPVVEKLIHKMNSHTRRLKPEVPSDDSGISDVARTGSNISSINLRDESTDSDDDIVILEQPPESGNQPTRSSCSRYLKSLEANPEAENILNPCEDVGPDETNLESEFNPNEAWQTIDKGHGHKAVDLVGIFHQRIEQKD
ncbi:hypothetical protein Avbf_14041 [Armadillidium vulgare]|nr:hypothetical protein Avbf_14041 [Armadillidium vulgare]